MKEKGKRGKRSGREDYKGKMTLIIYCSTTGTIV